MRHTDNEKLAELSKALDAVNRGEQPGGNDEEIKELAAVAQLVRRSGPPPDIVTGLADTLSAELTARKKRRRLWLSSGAAGTAAAALLVFVLNTGPSAPPQAPMTVPPAGSVVIQTVPQAVPEAAGKTEEAQPAKPPAKPPTTVAKEIAPAPAAKEAAPAQSAPEKTPAPERPAAVAADNVQAKQRTMLARVAEKSTEKAVNEAETAPAFLVWPGHKPDAATIDKDTDTVRQVYGSGESRIVITQQPAGGAAAAAKDEAAKSVGAERKTNRVTLTVRNFVVTVEGSLPMDELQKIARSLE